MRWLSRYGQLLCDPGHPHKGGRKEQTPQSCPPAPTHAQSTRAATPHHADTVINKDLRNWKKKTKLLSYPKLCIDWSQAASQSHPPVCPHTLRSHRIMCYDSEQPSLATPQCWWLSSTSLTESCFFPEWHFLTPSSRCDSNVSFPGSIFLLSSPFKSEWDAPAPKSQQVLYINIICNFAFSLGVVWNPQFIHLLITFIQTSRNTVNTQLIFEHGSVFPCLVTLVQWADSQLLSILSHRTFSYWHA